MAQAFRVHLSQLCTEQGRLDKAVWSTPDRVKLQEGGESMVLSTLARKCKKLVLLPTRCSS